MKRTLLLTALATASTLACAQDSVTVYGVVDAGVTSVSGLRGGSMKQLVSGIMDGSRIGIRGNEDLGGGYRAIVTLEHRLELDTGLSTNRPPSGSQLPDRLSQGALLVPNWAALPGLVQAQLQQAITGVAGSIGSSVGVNLNNAFWDRQAFVGLVTPVGAVLAGRQYTPAYEVSANFDTLGTQSALAAGQVASLPASIDIRQSNALAYRIVLGGLTASAMVTASEGSASTGRLMGVMAMYKTDAFGVGLGYNTRENELGDKSLTSTVLGASAKLGPGSLYLMGIDVQDDNPSGLSGVAAGLIQQGASAAAAGLVQNAFVNGLKQDGQLMHVGYKLMAGLSTVYVAYTEFDDKRAANADTRSYGVAYTYALSKRTALNAVVARFDNSGLGQAAPGGAGYLGGVTASAATDSTSLALGVRHSF